MIVYIVIGDYRENDGILHVGRDKEIAQEIAITYIIESNSELEVTREYIAEQLHPEPIKEKDTLIGFYDFTISDFFIIPTILVYEI